MPDPRLKTPQWERIKQHWRQVRDPCARCGQPIDYDGPRYVVDERGRKRENLMALDVDHILPKDIDHREVWQVEDTQPCHVFCNRQAGSLYRSAKHGQSRPLPRTSRDW